MSVQLFLVVVDAYPGSRVDEEDVVLVDTGFESLPSGSIIAFDNLYFMTTLLVKSPDPEPVISEFESWWSENMKGDISLECIATERSQLAAYRAEDLDKLPSGGWSLKASFVAFCVGSSAAYNEAKRVIFDSELLVQ